MFTVATLMQSHPETVPADMPLPTLERLFLESGFSGFPVVEGDRLIGVVSRSDVVRSLIAERSRAEEVSEFYSITSSTRDEEQKSLEAIAAQVGVRLAGLSVSDAMSRSVVSVESSESIRRLAELMLEGHLHRLPVVDDGRLVGLVTSSDLIRAIADGRLVESTDPDVAQELLSSTSS